MLRKILKILSFPGKFSLKNSRIFHVFPLTMMEKLWLHFIFKFFLVQFKDCNQYFSIIVCGKTWKILEFFWVFMENRQNFPKNLEFSKFFSTNMKLHKITQLLMYISWISFGKILGKTEIESWKTSKFGDHVVENRGNFNVFQFFSSFLNCILFVWVETTYWRHL